jgi:hypothetical protein
MIEPDELEREHTLLTAAARYDGLRTREALADEDTAAGDDALAAGERAAAGGAGGSGAGGSGAGGSRAGGSGAGGAGDAGLSRDEALELLALSEVIARKAGYGRQLSVRSARRAGASWSQIGAALGTSKQAAWEAHTRWIDSQAEQHRRSGYEGLDPDTVAAARVLAGVPDEIGVGGRAGGGRGAGE